MDIFDLYGARTRIAFIGDRFRLPEKIQVDGVIAFPHVGPNVLEKQECVVVARSIDLIVVLPQDAPKNMSFVCDSVRFRFSFSTPRIFGWMKKIAFCNFFLLNGGNTKYVKRLIRDEFEKLGINCEFDKFLGSKAIFKRTR